MNQVANPDQTPARTIRLLAAGDQATLEHFLAEHIPSSMFLLGNSRLAGLVDRGQRYEGSYVGAWEGDDLVAVLALYWNGNIVVQAPVALVDLLTFLADPLPRPVRGVLGPDRQVRQVLDWLASGPGRYRLDSYQYLYVLPLAELVIPPGLATGTVRVRLAERADLALLTEWRVGFDVESLGERPTPGLYRVARRGLEAALARSEVWIAEADGRPVATTGFNASIPEAVQVGGVWTPPQWRRRGYARAAVAGSLLSARAAGVRLGVLFTDADNIAAQRAYIALGFRRSGDFRITLLR